MQIRPLGDKGGVEIEGVDLSRPRSPDVDRELARLYDAYGLVVFRGQNLTKQQLLDATHPFGGPMITVPAIAPDPDVPGITVISTRGPNGDVVPENPDELVGDLEWHTDQGYVPVPNRGKILYSIEVPPEGGMTGFIDGCSTYDALSEGLKKQIEDFHIIQSWNRAESYLARNRAYRIDGAKMMAYNSFPDTAWPIVYKHPVTRAPVLNVPPLYVAGIVEMPGAEGEELLEQLKRHILQPQFQYWHTYRARDALIWDNWRFLHAASGTPGRHVRTLWSVVIQGGPAIGRLVRQAT